jgi:pimeloyl-ACP methyl ester carboxylesterase
MRRQSAQQPRSALAKLRTFPTEGVPSDVLATVNEQVRAADRQAASDQVLADAIREAAGAAKISENALLIEILAGLSEAPEAVRGRFEAFERARAEGAGHEAQFAFALSGWIAGAENASGDPAIATTLKSVRDRARDYLTSPSQGPSERSVALKAIEALQIHGKPVEMAILTEIVRLMPPPLRDEQTIEPGQARLLRVRDDPNPDQPSEYAVLLPPEYSPLRSYPVLVALHGQESPIETAAWWGEEASRRGYIVVAPEYNVRDRRKEYRYTESEGAAVDLAIRDALRRFAADPDRVFLAGSLGGGDMAWDFGLAHPDLFAGVAVLSGQPAKFVWANKGNVSRVPFYVAMGDLAPGEADFFFNGLARPLIVANRDLTYVQYYRRGLEALPEEIPSVFDWMAPRRREAAPRQFEVTAAREGDDRFYGLVVREFAAGRTKDPAAVDVLGKALKPATLAMKAVELANLVSVTTSGVRRLDIWVGPRQADFSRKMEVRLNNKTVFKGMPQSDPEAFLEDVRLRGDRSQVFWMKIPTAVGTSSR